MVPRSDRRSESGPEGSRAESSRAERRFFLARAVPSSWKQGEPVELTPADAEHARVVLRLAPGDRCIGLDGAGSAWPLLVTASDRRRFEVAIAGDRTFEPAPGEPGSRLPWIEVAVAMPRGARAEGMVDALVQLGVAAIQTLVTHRSPPPARSEGGPRQERLVRIAREACKQSGRAWNLEWREPVDVAALAGRTDPTSLRLDPRAEQGLSTRLEALGRRDFTRRWPLVLIIGPEGGFDHDEEAVLDAAGARTAAIAPHILRIETAAIAALSIAVERLRSHA